MTKRPKKAAAKPSKPAAAVPQTSTELAPVNPATMATMAPESAQMFERLVRDPDVPIEKLERMMALHERLQANGAKQMFDDDFSRMQGHLPIITKAGVAIVKKDGRLIRSTPYARFADIVIAIRPVLQEFGFSLRFKHELTDGKGIRTTGILAHRGGHQETDQFEAPADDTGAKNTMQAIASTRSYGQRYTATALLGLAAQEDDDDGHRGEADIDQRPQEERRAAAANPVQSSAVQDNTRGHVVSEPQLKRLHAIVGESGRHREAVKAWLKVRYGIDSTRQIKRIDYDFICTAIKTKGPLPLEREREPGEEG